MEYIVIGAEVFAAIWFVVYILMINGFLNEGKKNGFKMKDPLVKFFIGKRQVGHFYRYRDRLCWYRSLCL